MFSLLLFVYSPFHAPRKERAARRSPSAARSEALRLAEPPAPLTPGASGTGKASGKRRKAKGMPLRAIEGGRAGVP